MPKVQKELKPELIIATDVSCLPMHKIATWATIIYNDGWEKLKVGQFKDYISSGKAEGLAIANALYLANKELDLAKYDLKLYTDLHGFLDYKGGSDNPRPTKKYIFLRDYIFPYLQKAKSYELIEVRGKATSPELGARLQRKCHIASIKLRKKIIKELDNKP